jgi:hypothetical protein
MSGTKRYVSDLLIMTKDTDPDLRFMALNDLEKEISNPSTSISSHELNEYSKILLRCLDDEFTEVRVQALECFESIAYRLKLDIIPLIKQLSNKKPKKNSITSTIYTMALHNIIKHLPHIEQVHRGVIGTLLPEILNDKNLFYTEIDYIEVLNDLAEYLGKYMTSDEISTILLFLNNAVFYADTIISKKSILASNTLIKNVNNQNTIDILINKSLENFKLYKNKHDGKMKLLPLIASYISGNPNLISKFIDLLWKVILDLLDLQNLSKVDDDYETQQNNDIIRVEAILVLIKIFTYCKDSTTENLIFDALTISHSLISYDPYNNSNDGYESIDEDVDDKNDYDDYSDYEQDDDDDDDDNISWKLRTEALNLIMSIIENFPIKLPLVFKCDFDTILNNLLIEKNENVIVKIIETLSLIFESSKNDGPYYSLLNSKNMAETTSGRRYSDVSMQMNEDPYSEISSQSDIICNIISQFIDESEDIIDSKAQLILRLIANLADALCGLQPKYVESYVIALNKSGKSILANTDTFTFYSSLLENNTTESFGEGLEYLFTYLQHCLTDNINHRLVLEGLSLLNKVYSKKFVNISTNKIFAKFSNIFIDLLIQRVLNKNASTEIRLKSLNALVLLCTSIKLDFSRGQKVLAVFNDTLSSEVLVSSSLDAIVKILKANTLQDAITLEWVKFVLNLVLEYFNISEISLNAIKVVAIFAQCNLLDEEEARLVLASIEKLRTENLFSSSNCNDIGLILSQVLDKLDISKNLDSFVSIIVNLSSYDKFDEVLPDLMEKILLQSNENSISECIQKFGNVDEIRISKLLAVLTVTSRNEGSIETIIRNLKSGNEVYFSLVFLNQVAKSVDLNIGLGPFLSGYSSPESSIVNSTIKIVATIVSKYSDKYLNEFLNYMKQTVYLKPVFKTLARILENIRISQEVADEIFLTILGIQRNIDIKSEDSIDCTNAAECFGHLIIKYDLLSSLIMIFAEAPPELKVLIITAADTVKFTFNDSSFLKTANIQLLVKYAEATTKDFIFSPDLKLKEIGISNLNIILDKKPNIAIPLINKLIPNLIETEIKPNKDYIRTQFIGPYKHKIDDGLNYRKQVFEAIYYLFKALEDNKTLLFLCNINWSIYFNKFFDCGIKDDQSIVSISLLTTIKLFEQNPKLFITNSDTDVFDSFITRCRKVLNKKIADDAVKQDIEKQTNLVKMLIRFLKKTNSLVGTEGIILIGNQLSDWDAFIAETTSKFPIFNIDD